MLYWSVLFLVVALVAGVLGFGGVAATAGGIARLVFFIFLVLAAVTMLTGRGMA